MQVVIDITEKDYELMKDGHIPFNILEKMMKCTPLPEHHGRLIDENELKREAIRCEWSRNMYCILDYTLSYMKTILEAKEKE